METPFPSRHAETICAHLGEDPSQHNGAVIPPIYQNSLFVLNTMEERFANYALQPNEEAVASGMSRHYDYTRVGNPTTDAAEAKIAALEGAEQARCFGSGMGAISAAVLSCIKAGSHVIAPHTTYGPTRQLLANYLPRFGVQTTFIDGSSPQEYAEAIRPETTLLYLESPSSILMRQQDLEAVAHIARKHGARTICDNSWATPIYQNPLAMGVDLVVHSATKYLGGHSDIVAGVVCGSRELMHPLIVNEGLTLGAILDPFSSWLLIRGLRTLPIRMQHHCQNAKKVAAMLEGHSQVRRIYFPGSNSDPQKELTARQLRGVSGLLSVELKKQGRAPSFALANALRYFGIGCSWGGFESLALASHHPAEAFTDGEGERWLVRLHIGLEHPDDLISDLQQALEKAALAG